MYIKKIQMSLFFKILIAQNLKLKICQNKIKFSNKSLKEVVEL